MRVGNIGEFSFSICADEECGDTIATVLSMSEMRDARYVEAVGSDVLAQSLARLLSVIRLHPSGPHTHAAPATRPANAGVSDSVPISTTRSATAPSHQNAVCDMCNRSITCPNGYLLTTEQVVLRDEYWEAVLKGPWRGHVETVQKHGVDVTRFLDTLCEQQCGQSTAWLLCPQCYGTLNLNSPSAREYAQAWWNSGQLQADIPGIGRIEPSRARLAAQAGFRRVTADKRSLPSSADARRQRGDRSRTISTTSGDASGTASESTGRPTARCGHCGTVKAGELQMRCSQCGRVYWGSVSSYLLTGFVLLACSHFASWPITSPFWLAVAQWILGFYGLAVFFSLVPLIALSGPTARGKCALVIAVYGLVLGGLALWWSFDAIYVSRWNLRWICAAVGAMSVAVAALMMVKRPAVRRAGQRNDRREGSSGPGNTALPQGREAKESSTLRTDRIESAPVDRTSDLGLKVPPGSFTGRLAGSNRNGFASAITEISLLAQRGDRCGLDEMELLMRANCPSPSECTFHEPGQRSISGEVLLNSDNIVRDMVQLATTDGVLNHAEQVQRLILPLTLADAVGDTLDRIRESGGDREARCFELLYSHFTISGKYIHHCRHSSDSGAAEGRLARAGALATAGISWDGAGGVQAVRFQTETMQQIVAELEESARVAPDSPEHRYLLSCAKAHSGLAESASREIVAIARQYPDYVEAQGYAANPGTWPSPFTYPPWGPESRDLPVGMFDPGVRACLLLSARDGCRRIVVFARNVPKSALHSKSPAQLRCKVELRFMATPYGAVVGAYVLLDTDPTEPYTSETLLNIDGFGVADPDRSCAGYWLVRLLAQRQYTYVIFNDPNQGVWFNRRVDFDSAMAGIPRR